MRALIDARPALDRRPTGVGVYTDRLLRHLPAADPDGLYGAWFLHARGALRPERFFSDIEGLREFPSRIPSRVFMPLSGRFGWPRVRTRSDVFLATNFMAPPLAAGTRVGLVVHDLAFERLPDTAPHHDEGWRRRFRAQLGAATGVIVPSAAVRSDLLDLYDVDPERVHVVPHGVDRFEPPPEGVVEAVGRRFGIGGAYALFIGGLEPRKNLVTLVRAFAAEAGDGWLVIGGGGVPWCPGYEATLDAAIAATSVEVRARIVRTGYLDGEEKRALLAGATFLAYPSLAEGFGLPVLEAFAARVPVLASNVSSIPEVAGDAAVLVGPDEEAIRAGMARLFAEPDLRDRCIAAGTARVASFTWDRCAARTAEVLHRAAGSAG